MKLSALDRAIAQLETEKATLQACIDKLEQQRSAPKAPRVRKAKPAKKEPSL